jgi:hypothetical protein
VFTTLAFALAAGGSVEEEREVALSELPDRE